MLPISRSLECNVMSIIVGILNIHVIVSITLNALKQVYESLLNFIRLLITLCMVLWDYSSYTYIT